MAQKFNNEGQRRVLMSYEIDDIYSKLKVGEGWLKPDDIFHDNVNKEGIKDDHSGEHKGKKRNATSSEKVSNLNNMHALFRPKHLKEIEAYYINKNFKQSSLSLRKLQLNGQFTKLSGQGMCNKIHNVKNCCDNQCHSDETMSCGNECVCNQVGNYTSNDQNLHKAFKDVKAFREKYFFECHSAETMLNQKINTIRDVNHECQYDFYLNERLFLVPKCSDNLNQTRCSSCYLPVAYELEERLENNVNRLFKPDEVKRVETLSDLETAEESDNNYKPQNASAKPSKSKKSCFSQSDDKQNGIIDAKISLNSKLTPKDIIIELPVKMSLVIKEKWPNVKISKTGWNKIGVISLDYNKMFVQNKHSLPKDSYALKYQKGYTELKTNKMK